MKVTLKLKKDFWWLKGGHRDLICFEKEYVDIRWIERKLNIYIEKISKKKYRFRAKKKKLNKFILKSFFLS